MFFSAWVSSFWCWGALQTMDVESPGMFECRSWRVSWHARRVRSPGSERPSQRVDGALAECRRPCHSVLYVVMCLALGQARILLFPLVRFYSTPCAPLAVHGLCTLREPLRPFAPSPLLLVWAAPPSVVLRAEERGRVDQDQGRQGVEGPDGDGLPLRDAALAEPNLLLPSPSTQEVPQVCDKAGAGFFRHR